MTQHRFHATVLVNLKKLIRRDLMCGFFPHTEPPEKSKKHTDDLLDLTLFRGRETRGRSNHESPFDDQLTVELGQAMRRVLNGDWRSRELIA